MSTARQPAILPIRCAQPGRRAVACRCCGAPLTETLCDLGPMPLPGAGLLSLEAEGPEAVQPLRALFCAECQLVQLPGSAAPAAVASRGAEPRLVRALIARFHLDPGSVAVEIAGGGASLLPDFASAGIPVLCIPADAAAATAAAACGVPIAQLGPGAAAARQLRGAGLAADLVVVRGVLEAAADPHDVVAGLRILLSPGGVVLIDVPHLLPVLRGLRVDALGHDGRCLFSLAAVEALLAEHGLAVFDVGTPPGTLRLLARHAEDHAKPVAPGVEAMRVTEAAAGAEACRDFGPRLVEAKCALLDFLVGLRRAGRSVAAIGATEGGDRLLRYCGVGPELLPFVADAGVSADGLCLPGTRIPVMPPSALSAARPDFVLLLVPPDAAARIATPAAIHAWGGRLATPIPILQLS